MTSAFLLIPLFLIRYGLLGWVNKNALPRAAHFPPLEGFETAMYWVYQASTLALMVVLLLLKITSDNIWLAAGWVCLGGGSLLLALSVVDFAKPQENVFSTGGVYCYSRNPMYIAYFLYFLGCGMLTKSPIVLGLVCVFQLAAHWVIVAEERWCMKTFGEPYRQYCQKVRRYV